MPYVVTFIIYDRLCPTEVKIAGVVMSTQHLMRAEDVVDILLNIKGIVLKLHHNNDAILSFKKKLAKVSLLQVY